jgi:hypothetical protein
MALPSPQRAPPLLNYLIVPQDYFFRFLLQYKIRDRVGLRSCVCLLGKIEKEIGEGLRFENTKDGVSNGGSGPMNSDTKYNESLNERGEQTIRCMQEYNALTMELHSDLTINILLNNCRAN